MCWLNAQGFRRDEDGNPFLSPAERDQREKYRTPAVRQLSRATEPL
jgi:hypothetical protein